jgi:GT2 family glycosyltransferase
MSSKKSKAICVLGMHRSGTSVIARSINLLGAYIGEENDLLPSREENPEGFWENKDIVELHENILGAMSSTWDSTLPLPNGWWKLPKIKPFKKQLTKLIEDNFLDKQVWIWKDPRTCLLIPLWEEILTELEVDISYVVCMRNPIDVATSLEKRNGFSRDKSLGLWTYYTLSSLISVKERNYVLIDYDEFLADWQTNLNKITNKLDIPYPTDDDYLKEKMSSFIKPNLHHNKSNFSEQLGDYSISNIVKDTYQLCVDLKELNSKETNDRISSLYNQFMLLAKMVSNVQSSCKLQVYWYLEEESNKEYTEEKSKYIGIEADGIFHEYEIILPEGLKGPLRLDPVDIPAYVEIKSIKIISGTDGLVLGEINSVNSFGGLVEGANVIQLNGLGNTFNFISANNDCQFFIENTLDNHVNEDSLILRIEIRVITSITDGFVEVLENTGEEWIKQKNEIIFSLENEINKLASTVEEYVNNSRRQSELIMLKQAELLAKDELLLYQSKELENLNIEIENKNANILELNQQVQLITENHSILFKSAQENEEFLQLILNSRSWKALGYYFKLRDKTLPVGSKRRLFAKLVMLTLLNPKVLINNFNKKNLKKFVRGLKYSNASTVSAQINNKIKSNNEISATVYHVDDQNKIENIDEYKENMRLFMKEKLKIFLNLTDTKISFPKSSKPKISIVLVLYNKAEYTYQCLETIKAYADVPYEIIIVDNASVDETGAMLDKINDTIIIKNQENVGFLKACNQGAKLAQGEWLLFLNNDTQITPTLLSTLLMTAEKNDKCGAVGGKLIFPDGKLQEAGSIIWNDGSSYGFGRGEDPFKPEFSYVKEVYYASGACLLVNNDVFKDVGMLDELFYPAYYEETDLCMKIRAAGYKVLFQPSAVVIHYEFGSSSSMSKAIELQEINKKKFVDKWEKELAGYINPDLNNVLQAREFNRENDFRILFVEDRIPVPELGSGYPRSYMILKCAAELGFRVTLFPLQIPEKVQPYTNILQQLGIEVLSNDKQEKLNFRDFYSQRSSLYDAVWISRPHNMSELIGVIKEITPNQKIIYDAEALFSTREILKLELNGKKVSASEKNELIKEEITLMKDADIIITVSENEKETIQTLESKPVEVIAYPVNTQVTPNRFEERKDILFVGGFLSTPSPNEDAMVYFANEIFPKIHKETGARLFIVGTNVLDSIKNMSSDIIVVTGRVDEVWEYYNKCRVFVVPTRYAAGIPLKLLECFSHGLPAVVSPLMAEQLNINEEVVSIGQNIEDFATKVIDVYNDVQLWEKLKTNGLEFVDTNCSQESFKSKIKDLKIYFNG